MLYYLGKGTEFKKEDCKEYKTIEGAMKAAAKDESFVVWDENGNLIGSLRQIRTAASTHTMQTETRSEQSMQKPLRK